MTISCPKRSPCFDNFSKFSCVVCICPHYFHHVVSQLIFPVLSLFRVFNCKYNTAHNRQHTTDTIHSRQTSHKTNNTQQTDSTHNPQSHRTHMHFVPLPSSVVLLKIRDKSLIARGFRACLVSTLAATMLRFDDDDDARARWKQQQTEEEQPKRWDRSLEEREYKLLLRWKSAAKKKGKMLPVRRNQCLFDSGERSIELCTATDHTRH